MPEIDQCPLPFSVHDTDGKMPHFKYRYRNEQGYLEDAAPAMSQHEVMVPKVLPKAVSLSSPLELFFLFTEAHLSFQLQPKTTFGSWKE